MEKRLNNFEIIQLFFKSEIDKSDINSLSSYEIRNSVLILRRLIKNVY